MAYLYQQIFYRPLLNVLIFFYQTVAFHDLGIAIILATLLIRIILYPFFHKGAKQQMLMQRIQPKIKDIQKKHKDDRDQQAKALMELYKEHGVNPFSGMLLLIIQIPILLTFYWVIRSGIGTAQVTGLYSFVGAPTAINPLFLGFINLANPNFILIIAAALAQYLQARLAIYRNPTNTATLTQAEKIARQMVFVGPIVTLLVFYNFPAALGLYWFVSSLFSAVQQYFVNKHLQKKYGA
ncbi:MAG TPA: YidC/Oxa1 family membrane protein insertase [Candidatus Paceibacterota bacterium]|nr:YidC/Oxa1 family membrane protein insertase [Candidatus Paceibacterota bacterium]